ncbi:uncharacterized protein LOC125378092 [Haliotis rufescens]|uniref:uncharacterized protein LOC125378092 n=1 Tax=Haliotis rufescens TaxID=6454 RepID=UPI00201F1E99|nr:uncharacterized protein LOC125378092 [Haliotis rufescens]
MVSRRLFPEQVRPESLCYAVVVFTYVRCACVDIESLLVENSSMPEKGFRVLESSTLYECGAECLMNQNCMSINFEKKYKRCHLNTDDSNNGTIIHEEGVVYSDIKYWPKSLIGPCENVSCIPGERCTVDRLQRPHCVEDVQHCGSPPSTGNGSMNHQLQSFGAVASYDCDDGYVYCRHTRNIHCQRDGTWEEASTCEKYIWNETVMSIYNFKEN